MPLVFFTFSRVLRLTRLTIHLTDTFPPDPLQTKAIQGWGPRASPLCKRCTTHLEDASGSWRHAAVVEANPEGNFAYPTVIEWEPGVVKVAYTFWGQGLRIATVTLPSECSALPEYV
eukprot:1194955-Prorocentrum_minimum.AAC.3